MTKKRVLFSIGSLGGGGAERQVIQYLTHLDRSQFEPVLYLTKREGPFLSEVPDDVPIASFEERVALPRWNFPGAIYRLQVQDFRKFLVEQQIDLVCAVTIMNVLVAGEAIKAVNRPWLAVSMADLRNELKRELGKFSTIKHRKLCRAFRAADRVIAVSTGDREGLFACHNVDPEKTLIVPNSVDIERVETLASEPSPNWDPHQFHIVLAGRLTHQKGHRFLIEAMDQIVHQQGMKQVQLHLLGQGELESDLKNMVSERNLDDHIEFAGFIDNPFPYLKAADLFCLPSLYEGMPLILLEAMACGVPIVATDCPSGPRELLEGGRYGRLVTPECSGDLANAITEAIENSAWREEVSRSSKKHVAEKYESNVTIRQLENHLLKIAQSQG
ncbi:glycosyltransferase [Rubinisphaera italica]|uniref:4-alpha-N-acetylgalactosaminyltransferase n=1 Tax=Rubinisphaera italica TaxID=2527969 RepID=A0A5C5XF95_9PLAN|nr:glycosyltransferase [Rubinisphaera italica]TWT61101.1 4-alpha-N-acetylgalactosaminyltransferase [Rubinisphaera italica]